MEKKGIMSWAINNAIKTTKDNKLEIFDFNGANSPMRGDNKHSFGAKSTMYFKLMNDTTPPVEPQKKDFKTTLYREIEKLKDE